MTSALTYTRVLPSPSERRLAQQLSRMDGDIQALYDQLRTAQLGTSTIQGSMAIRDADGVLTGIIGVQGDGTTGISYQNGSPPPAPNTPDLIPFAAGLYVAWNGQFPTASKPANFRNVEVYLGTTPSFIPGPSNYYGFLSDAGQVPIGPLNSGSSYYAVLIATNLTEKPENTGTGFRATATASLYGGPASPQQVVAQAVLDGIISATALADQAVTAAKVAVGAIDGTKIADDAITSPKIVAGTIQGGDIAAQTISGGLIATDTLDARTIGALAIAADALQANSVTAGALAAGCVTAAKLEADLVLASRVVAGTLAGARVEIHPTIGLQGFRSDGVTQTFSLRADSGAFTATGSMSTAFAGSRIMMNYNGGEPDRIRFYPGSGTNYAAIDSITSPNGAGIEMYSSAAPGSSSKRGIVIAREDIASLIYGSPDLSAIDTDIFATVGNARVRAGITDMMVDSDQASNARVVFQVTDGVSAHSNTILYYHDSGADEPHFAAVNNDVGITFGDSPGSGLNSRLWIVGNTIAQRRDLGCFSVIYDGDLIKSSSRVQKRNIVAAADLDMRQSTRQARAHRFEKIYLDEGPVISPEDGAELRGPRKAPTMLGLIAEEMPEQCQTTIVEALPGEDILGINVDQVVTLLWQGQGDVWDELDRRAADPIPIRDYEIPPQPPLTGGLLYVYSGRAWIVLSTGVRHPI
jgi:hypothetical protein